MKVKIYQQPASTVNYDFSKFIPDLQNHSFTRGLTNLSIQWTPDWSDMANKYANVEALEQSDKYRGFTDYVINNYDAATKTFKNLNVLNYLKRLEELTTGSPHNHILFNENNELINDWDKEYRRLRNDQKYGFYHLGPEGNYEPGKVPGNPPEEIPFRNPVPWTPTKYFPHKPIVPKPTFSDHPWTDWIPLTLKAMIDSAVAWRNYQNDLKKDVALVDPKHHEYKTESAYLTRQLLTDQLNEMRSLANALSTSDLDASQKYRQRIENESISALEDKKALLLDLRTNETMQRATAVGNYNNDLSVEAGNINMPRLVALKNYLIDAIKTLNEKLGNIAGQYFVDMYTNYGAYKETQRKNLNAKTIRWADAAKLANLASAYDELNWKTSDITHWDGYGDFALAVGSGQAIDPTTLPEEYANIHQLLSRGEIGIDSPEAKAYLQYVLENSPKAASYRARYAKSMENASNDFRKAQMLAESNYNRATGNLDLYTDNQIFDHRLFGGRRNQSSILQTGGVVKYKNGGESAASKTFGRVIAANLKNQHSVRSNAEKRSKRFDDALNKELDRITKELLQLLKAMFS